MLKPRRNVPYQNPGLSSLFMNFIALAVISVSLGGCGTMAGLGSDKAKTSITESANTGSAVAEANAAAEAPQVEKKTQIEPAMLYQLLVAEIAMQRGQIDVAVENYLEAAKLTHDPEAAARAAQIARYAQDYSKANEAAEIWVKSAPASAEARLVYASILLLSGNADAAAAQYQKMVEISKADENKAFSVIANQLARIPDRVMAMTVMEKIIAAYPENPYAMFSYAHLAMRQAKFDAAVEKLDKALALKPKWPNAVVLRARILALQQGRDKALEYLEEALQGSLADDIDVGITYAKLLVESKQYERAMDQFIHLTEVEPDNMDIHYPAGVLAIQLQRYDLARDLLTKVVKSGNRYYEANYYLGQVAEQTNSIDKAIEHYTLVKRGDLYFSAQVRAVSLFASKKEFGKAKQHLQSIRPHNDKQELQLILLEGDLLREQGLFTEAKAYYSKMLDQMPNETTLRYARALVAEKLGEIELVERDLQQILETEPANAQVLNALGYTLADRTDRYEEALGYIKRALDIEPNDAAIMDSMGWVLYHMGNYQEAISHLRRANDIAKDPEIAAHLGEVLWVSGNKDAAKDIWTSSLKGNPQHKALLEVMKRFGL